MNSTRSNVMEHLPSDLIVVLDLLELRLREFYGDRYSGLVLYGSHARGEADEGSDIDLLLILKGKVNPAQELRVAGRIKWPLSLRAGYTISLLPVSIEAYKSSEQPFLRNARGEGVALS